MTLVDTIIIPPPTNDKTDGTKEEEINLRFKNMKTEMQPVFNDLQLTEIDVHLIEESFNTFDISDKGSIHIKELEVFLKIEPSNFITLVLAIFDEDRSGELDFFEVKIYINQYTFSNIVVIVLYTVSNVHSIITCCLLCMESCVSICMETRFLRPIK